MKSYLRIIFTACLIAGIFAFHSRSRDTNAFNYKGQIHNVQHAYVDSYKKAESVSGYSIYLGSVSKSTSLNYINLSLNSNGATGISPGVYHLNNDAKEQPFTLSRGKFMIAEDEQKEAFYATSGMVKISKWGENHVIEYHLKLNNGEDLNGIFRGKIEQIEKPV